MGKENVIMSLQHVRSNFLRDPSAKTVVLNAALIGSESVLRLWKAALGADQILVKDPIVSDSSDRLFVTGKASFLNIDEMPIEICFEDDDSRILQMRLIANLPDAWTFRQSFPDLAPYFNYDSLNYGYKPSYLNDLRFSSPVFVLTTYPHKGTKDGIQFARGLNFSADLDVLGALKELEPIIGNLAPVSVSGLIISDPPTQEFCLSARIPLNLGRDASTLQFQNIELKLWNSLAQNESVVARMEISMQLKIADKAIELYSPFRIGSPLDFVVIGGRFSNLPLPDLGKISYLVGGEDLESRLPPSLKSFGGLTIEEVVTGFSLSGPELAYVRVCVATTSPWTVVPQIFEIKSLALNWLVESPFKSERRHISCELEGLLQIADVGFRLYAKWPDFLVSGALALGSTIKLGALLKHFVPSIPLAEDSLIISRAALLLDPTSKTYEIDARVDNVWSMALGGTRLAMDSLSLWLTKSAEGITGSLTGGMSLRLNDADAESGLTLSLAASLPPPSAKGWQFTAKTGPGQRIHVGKLIEWIAKGFGPTLLPTAIGECTIEDLGISFNTGSKDFFFTCEGKMTLPGQKTDLQATVTIDIKHQGESNYTKLFGGSLTIDGIEFNLIFESSKTVDGDSNLFVAAYHDPNGQPIKIDELIHRFFNGTSVKTGLDITLKDALFAYRKTDKEAKYLFGLDIEGGLNLSELNLPNLPLIGQPFPAGQTLKLALQVLAAGKSAFTLEEIKTLNRLNRKGISLPEQEVTGLKLAALLRVGEETKPLSLPIGLGSKGDGLEEKPVDPETRTDQPNSYVRSADDTQWIKIQKTFGPIHVERVGIGFKDGKLGLLLDAALTAAGLTLSLDGLGAEFALKDLAAKTFKPTFHLNGLGIDYRSGPLEIGGSFLEQKGKLTPGDIDYTSYAGLAVIRTAKLTLSAIGSYTQLNDCDPSLFIYAVANYALGGPAFFYVTGFAAGFGYNRALILPPIENLASFPLIAEAVKDGGPAKLPSGQKEQQETLTGKLAQLDKYLPPSLGDIFIAAGIKFTSFKQIDSFALLVVKFGRRFEIDLLGLSTLTAPPPEAGKAVAPIAEAQLALKATFIPDEGFLGVRAQLTSNSYILSKDCHLNGGFAFYTWFEPHRQAGDFVLTLGGYHPKFIAPEHYPQVPRLSLNWQVNSELHLKADAYFALTGSAIMAGAHLQATWQSGALRAWFNAGADFILAWKPYHYELELYIGMGVSYTFEAFGNQTLSVDLGANLHLWGPPFSGTATIHWSIISFTVNFGQDSPQRLEKLDWETFKSSFLPNSAEICSVVVQQGLMRQMKAEGEQAERWIVNPKEMVLAINSTVPLNKLKTLASHLRLDGPNLAEKALTIAPMGIESNLESTCSIEITRDDGQKLEKDKFQVRPIRKSMPAGLWGKPHLSEDREYLKLPNLNAAPLVENLLTGFEIRPVKRNQQPHSCSINRDELQYTIEPPLEACGWQDFSLSELPGKPAWNKATQTAAVVRKERARLMIEALGMVNAVIDFGEPVDQGVLLAA
jgi:hypothetical protein